LNVKNTDHPKITHLKLQFGERINRIKIAL